MRKDIDDIKVEVDPSAPKPGSFFARLAEIVNGYGVDAKLGPQNRAQRRMLQRRMDGHRPGPRHRQMKAARRTCREELVFGDRKMTCGAQLPSYRERCLWHEQDVVVSMFGRTWLRDRTAEARYVEVAL